MKANTLKWDGKQITKPGMYSGIPLELYHKATICDGPSVSSSMLRMIISQSPAHFYAQWEGNPDCVEPKDTRAFILGRALHHLMLGEPFFATLFVIQPKEWPDEKGELKPWHNGRKVCKEWNAKQAKAGRAILTPAEVEQIKGMAKSLGKHPLIKPPVSALNGAIERSIFWKDKATGLWLKIRPDAIPGDSGDFVDLKKTTSVQYFDIIRSIEKLGYFQQGALICQGAREVLGIERPTFTLVFIEDDVPFCPRVVTLKENDLAVGDKANRVALDIFARCLKSGHWPGPGGERADAEYVEMTDHARARIEDKLTILGAG